MKTPVKSPKSTRYRNSGYGLTSPLLDVLPWPIQAQRSPLGSDLNYPVGQMWINNKVGDADFGKVWMMVAIGPKGALWTQLG